MAVPLPLPSHLGKRSPPWSGLLVLPREHSATTMLKAPPGFLMRTIEGKKCRTSSSLFDEFSRVLSFPEYFGHNWDALEECLADLEWLPAKGYILLISDAHAVLPDDEEEYETLLEVLSDAGEAWSKGQTTDGRSAPFHTVFAVTEQNASKRHRWELEVLRSTAQGRAQKNLSRKGPAASRQKPTRE